jgi:arylsulfatase A-like enzyme
MRLKRITTALAIGAVTGFILGLIVSLRFIIPNRYIQYKMFRLIVFSLQESLSRWTLLLIIWSFVVFVLVLLLLLIVRLIWKSLLSDTIEVNIKDEERLLRVLSACLICPAFFLYGGWAINRYWLPHRFHPISLLGDVGILVFTMFLGWILLKANWEKIFGFSRRIAFILVIVLLTLNVCVLIDSKIGLPKGPNVILIVVDTLRAGHLSCYGYSRNSSPFIDRLAGDSVLFRNAISAAPWTTPSLASMFTSQYPAQLGYEDMPVVLGSESLTLAEIFREYNYRTKGIISHVYISQELGFDQGFDSYDEDNARGHLHISSPSVTRKAISYVESQKNDRFFLFLHYFDPHYSYMLHERYNYYPAYDGPLQSGLPIRELRKEAPDMSTDDIAYTKALYDSEISFTDKYIGDFLDKLKELGLYENTLIVFTADHGEEFLERGDYWIGHTKKLYQEQIHVPLIMKLAGGNKQEIMEEPVGLIDLMPTIIDCANLSIPNEYACGGEVLDLGDGRQQRRGIIISETGRWATLQSLMWKGWKLIYDPTTGSRELYNLTNDPAESNNVAMENEEVLREMKTILQDWSKVLGKPRTEGRQPEFTEEQKERLRSLGYLR